MNKNYFWIKEGGEQYEDSSGRNILRPGERISVSYRKYNSINYMFGRNIYVVSCSENLPSHPTYNSISAGRLPGPKTKCWASLSLLGHLLGLWTFQTEETGGFKIFTAKF